MQYKKKKGQDTSLNPPSKANAVPTNTSSTYAYLMLGLLESGGGGGGG